MEAGLLEVSGVRALNGYNFIINHCLSHLSLMKEKMFSFTNVIRRAISCFVGLSGRFAGVGSVWSN